MAKYLSETERRLQKKLIPLNIFVCILALVAAVSLFMTPLVKINVGKIVKTEAVMQLAEDEIAKIVTQDEPENGMDVAPVVSAIVTHVLSNVEGNISVSAFSTLKVALAKENRMETLTDELFFGDKGFVDKLIDSIADGVAGMFETNEGKAAVQEAMVTAITTGVVAGLPDNVTVDAEKLTELTRTLLEIDGKDRAGAEAVVTDFVNQMDGLFGEDYNIGESKENIKNYVMDMYDDTVAELEAKGENFSLEAMICVAVSKNADLGDFNLGELIKGMMPDEEEKTPSSSVKYILAEGDKEEEKPSESEPSPLPPESSGEEGGDKVICTTYPELLEAMGLGNEDIEELKGNLKTVLRDAVNVPLEQYEQFVNDYWYAFLAPLAFMVPWIILFLFSFFHMLAKNKRFMMWYVKLFGFLPCLIFAVVPLAAPLAISKLLPMLGIELAAEQTGLIFAVLGGIGSMTWISGGCYVLLWLFSIFWAFPIKHKIRKERKLCKKAMKNGTYSYDNYGYGDNTGGKKQKRGKKAKVGKNAAPYPGADYGAYGGGYGADYGTPDYGAPDYGSPYGDSYGGGYGGSYDDGGFDDDYDYDSFGSPPYDMYGGYGSLYDDDDDDY